MPIACPRFTKGLTVPRAAHLCSWTAEPLWMWQARLFGLSPGFDFSGLMLQFGLWCGLITWLQSQAAVVSIYRSFNKENQIVSLSAAFIAQSGEWEYFWVDKDKAVERYECYTKRHWNHTALYMWTRGSKHHLWVPLKTLDQFLTCVPEHLQKSYIVCVGTSFWFFFIGIQNIMVILRVYSNFLFEYNSKNRDLTTTTSLKQFYLLENPYYFPSCLLSLDIQMSLLKPVLHIIAKL